MREKKTPDVSDVTGVTSNASIRVSKNFEKIAKLIVINFTLKIQVTALKKGNRFPKKVNATGDAQEK